jgi:hypothetical protein
MNRLRITKNGLKLLKWNSELRGETRIQQDGEDYVVKRKSDRAVLYRASSNEDAEEFYWQEAEIQYPWVYLRDSVNLDEGITVEDIYRLIKNEEELEALCDMLWPLWEDYKPTEDNVLVYRQGVITGGTLTFECLWNTNTDKTLELAESLRISRGEDVLCEEEYHLSFLELLDCLFGCPNRVLRLTKTEGLIDAEATEESYTLQRLVEDPLRYLLHPVVVDENVTVGDVFCWVDQQEMLKNFISMYSWCREIDAFHAEAKKEPEPDEWHNKIHYAEAYRSIEVHVGRYRSIDEGLMFHGIGDIAEETLEHYQRTGEPAPTTDAYSLSGSHASSYANLPLRAEEMVEIRQMPVYSRKGNCKESLKILAKVRCRWTLLDLLDAIYWDISFFGGPNERDQEMQTLQDRIKDYEENKEEGIPIEELLERLDRDEDD